MAVTTMRTSKTARTRMMKMRIKMHRLVTEYSIAIKYDALLLINVAWCEAYPSLEMLDLNIREDLN